MQTHAETGYWLKHEKFCLLFLFSQHLPAVKVHFQPIQRKSLQLDNIDFIIGTTNYTPESEPKLRRLKEFLALNAGIKIEIQGHVNETGQSSFDGQQISEARAKRVKKYLVENGINKDRLTTVGLGNTKPIYTNPKLASEEQANRRVEIKIIN